MHFVFSVQIFRHLLHRDREEHQSQMTNFGHGPMINLVVRRNYIYEDAFEKLSQENGKNRLTHHFSVVLKAERKIDVMTLNVV